MVKETCDVCGAPLPQPIRINRKLVQTCEGCFTQYGAKGQVDNTDTVIGRHDCQHRGKIMLYGTQWANNFHNVTLCMDCGEFVVSGRKNGQAFDVHFLICGEEFLTGAARFNRLVLGQPLTFGKPHDDVYCEIHREAYFAHPEFDDSDDDGPEFEDIPANWDEI